MITLAQHATSLSHAQFHACRQFAHMTPEAKMEVVRALSDEEALALTYTWEAWARDKQLEEIEAPGGRWSIWLHLAGRGNGKTRTGAEWIRKQAESNKIERMILVARTAADVRDTMVEGESGLMAISPPWFKPLYQPSKRRITWPNGATAITFSADEPDALRGPQCLVGSTNVLMADGSHKKIADICVGDYVMTRKGSRRVTGHCLTKRNAEVYLLRSVGGRAIIGTADHPVWVEGRGFTPMSLLSKGMPLCVTPALSGMDTFGTSDPEKTTTNAASFSIEPSGNRPTGQSKRDAIFTTGTATRPITGLKTWNCSLMASIVPYTTPKICSLAANWQRLTHEQRRSVTGKYDLDANSFVRSVGRNITAALQIQGVSVLPSASRQFGQKPLKARRASASIVLKNTAQRNECNSIALRSATNAQAESEPRHSSSERSLVTTAVVHSSPNGQTHASVHAPAPWLSTTRIATVERLAKRYDVYDIAVEDAHEFFAEGILVHNCERFWADERASWQYDEAWDNLMFGARLGAKPQGVVTTTPRATKAIKELKKAKTTKVTIGSTYENRDNLAPAFFEEIIKKYEGTRLGRQELLAEILEDVEGALWNRTLIEDLRVTRHPNLVRVVVAIDPATTSEEGSAETGIVVLGLGNDGHLYVLDDRSLQASPQKWATEAVAAYHKFGADRIVAEANNGGDMVEGTLRQVDPRIPYKKVTATRDKHTRAEPVSAVYEQGRAHHVGCFPNLEDQLCEWLPGEKSPDRLDALVWGATELLRLSSSGKADTDRWLELHGMKKPVRQGEEVAAV